MDTTATVEVDDNPVRPTLNLSPEEIERREREKKQLLGGIAVPTVEDVLAQPRARRRGLGNDEEYPDQTARRTPAPATPEELAAERQAAVEPPRATRVPGMQNTIEALAAQVREDEARLKESKALLKRALKRLGVR